MSAAQLGRNKATLSRLHNALNRGDEELISTTIDEVFDPDVHIGTPLPIDATGAQALKQVWTTLLRAYPDLHVTDQDPERTAPSWTPASTSTGFTEAERAALELTEQGTRIADAAGGATDEVWAKATEHYDEEQLGALVSLIAVINAFNQVNVITRQPAGDYQPGQFR